MVNELVSSAKNGDTEAFSRLVESHYRSVYGLAYSGVGNWSAAEDIAQETFLVAWANLAHLKTPGAFTVWLGRIARNLARNWRRSAAYRRNLQERQRAAAEAAPQASSTADVLDKQEARTGIWKAIETLSPRLREVVVLYYLEENSVHDVALALGASESAVKQRLRRARIRLRTHFEQHWEAEMESERLRLNPKQSAMGLMALLPLGPANSAVGNSAATAALGWQVLFSVNGPINSAIGFTMAMSAKQATAYVVGLVLLILATWWTFQGGPTPPTPIPGGPIATQQEEDKDTRADDASTEIDITDTLTNALPKKTASGQPATALPQKTASITAPARVKGAIHGHVVDAETEEGIAGVVVRAVRGDSGKNIRYDSEPSDETGAFIIANLPAGAYNVKRRGAEGYRSEERGPDIKQVTVYTDEVLDGLVFELTKGVTVSGRVVDERGAGVANASILIGGGSGLFFNSRNQTGPDGAYAFTGLTPTGDVWLHATAGGLAHRMEGPVTIPHEGVEDLTLTMTREAVVAGILVDGNGVPIPRYEINLEPDFRTRMGGCSDITDGEGKFRIAAVFEGAFEIMVNPTDKGYIHPNRRIVDSIEVRAGAQIGGLRLVYDVATDLTISGRVTDTFGEPVAGERVGYIPTEAGSASEHVLSDADGYYRIEGLSEGIYDIDVYRIRNNFSHTFAEQSGVPAGTENLNFVITRFTTVRGRVVQSDGRTPVTDFEILKASGDIDRLAQALSRPRFKQTIHDPQGRFELDMIGPGTLTVVVRAEGYLGTAETIEITEGDAIENLVVRLEPGGPLKGRVINETGEAIPDAVIYLGTLRYYERSPDQPIAHSQDDGTFEIASPVAGKLILATVHPDYAYAVQSVHVPHSGPVQIVLPWGGYVAGIVRLDGEPAPGGRVDVYRGDDHTDLRLRGPRESDGSFEIGPAPPGEMLVYVNMDTGERKSMSKQKSVYVESEKTTVVDFDFFSGMSSVFGEISAESEGWRWCRVQLKPQDERQGTKYSISVERASFFQIDNVFPGLYSVDAYAHISANEILRYNGEVAVPESGEVRHDVMLILEE